MRLCRLSLTLRLALILSLVSFALWWIMSGSRSFGNRVVLQSIQRDDPRKTRELLAGGYNFDWNTILAELDSLNDKRLYQKALDAQFEYRGDIDPRYPNPYPYNFELGVVQQLVMRGAQPTYRHLKVATDVSNWPVALYLLCMGVPTRGKLGEGNALTDASRAGDQAVVLALIAKGADVNASNDTPRSTTQWRPLQAAAQNGHTEIVKILLNHGADPMLPERMPAGDRRATWETIRQAARDERKAFKAHATPYHAMYGWWIIKPVVEERLGHPVEN